MTKWINVEDRLPPLDEEVLISYIDIDSNGRKGVEPSCRTEEVDVDGTLMKGWGHFGLIVIFDDTNRDKVTHGIPYKVTHWMPLPEPPED